MGNRYRKKPVEIEAFQLGSGLTVLPDWFLEAERTHKVLYSEAGGHWAISTEEGVMLAKGDDWIIRGVKGELYPCKADIFAMTYEAA